MSSTYTTLNDGRVPPCKSPPGSRSKEPLILEPKSTLTLTNPKEVNAVHISRHVKGCHVQHALGSRDPRLPEIHPLPARPSLSSWWRHAVRVSTLDRQAVGFRRPPTPRGHVLANVSSHASSRHAHAVVTMTSHLPPSWHPMGTMAGIRPSRRTHLPRWPRFELCF